MKTYGLYESASVKIQVLKTAIEVSFVCPQLFFFKLLTIHIGCADATSGR